MPTNPYTAELINSIESPPEQDEEGLIELRRRLNETKFQAPHQGPKTSKLYTCECGQSLVTGTSKHIRKTFYYDHKGNALPEDKCPKCGKELPQKTGREVK